MTKEKQAIEYIKKYRELDEKLYNTAPKGTVSSIATNKCLEFWDMAIKALEQESCEDAISRKEAVEAFQMFREYESNRSNEGWVNRIETVLNQLPPVTPQQKMGRWIYGEDNLGTGRDGWYCNQCGHFEFWDNSSDMKSAKLNLPNPCPNCGVKMVEPQERSGEE